MAASNVSGSVQPNIEGVAAWLLSGGTDIIVICFSKTIITVGTKSVGTQLNDALVKEIKALDQNSREILPNIDKTVYGFTVDASNLHFTATTLLSATVIFLLTGTPVPLPDEDTVCLTIRNATSSVNYKRNPAFDLIVVQPAADFLDSGIVRSEPISVHSHFCPRVEQRRHLRLPLELACRRRHRRLRDADQTNCLVVYFDVTQVLLKLVPKGTALNETLVKDVAANGEPFLSGSFAIGKTNYDFIVSASSNNPTEKTLNGTLDFFCFPTQ